MLKKISNLLSIVFEKKKIPKYILKYGSIKKAKLIKTHKNNINVIYLIKEKIFRKFSKNPIGINKIKYENQGLSWYCKRNKINKNNIIKKFFNKKNLAFIDLKEISGNKVKSWKSLESNYKFLIKTINHYIKFYPKKKISKIHGDLTLDNIIFDTNKIFIIDWEFFGSKKNHRGYDLVYLILSSACLPYILNKKFSQRDQKIFLKLWKILIKKDFNKEMLFNPFEFFKKNIKKDKVLAKSYQLSKSKFFVFIISNPHKIKIMKLINSLKNEK